MADVTLTASMRANLYSLQQTADLMGMTQNKLSTGKKVNSALDNPNNYFTSQSLSNRASDIGALLDGMGQAIQTIQAASKGIESAQKLIDQMKSVANSALSSANSSAAGDTTAYEAAGTKVSEKVASATANDMLLVNLKNGSTEGSLGIEVGDTFAIAANAGTAVTFTVESDTTVKDFNDFLTDFDTASGGAVITGIAFDATTGALTISIPVTTAALSMTGDLADALGLAGGLASSAAATVTTVALSQGPMLIEAMAAGATDDNVNVHLSSLTDANGDSLGIAVGDTLTFKLDDGGETLTFTVGGDGYDSTAANMKGKDGGGVSLEHLQNWLSAQSTTATDFSLTASADGKVSMANSHSDAVTIGGKLAEVIGINGDLAALTGSKTSTTALYITPMSDSPVATGDTLISELTRQNGMMLDSDFYVGSSLTVNTTQGTHSIWMTEGMTVDGLLSKLNEIDADVQFSMDTAGKLKVDNGTANSWTIGGNLRDLFATDADFTATANAVTTSSVELHAGYSPVGGSASGSGVIDASKKTQFDTLRQQLDELVQDASYQGINLISGTTNSPLTVTFNEAATNANKLVINAVDLSTTGLGIKAAAGSGAGAWANASAVEDTLSTLTSASGSLRTEASNLGYNLSTVQTRQDFAKNLIATLKEGSDKLTLADMNEEGANMLALQTRSQLGTQSLSLASQANAAVMRLFG